MLNCNVKEYGAAGDGIAKDTAAIQSAIDDCGAHGGGQVVLSEGRFLTGMIRMRSGVELRIERDAVLLGSTDGGDFPEIETDFWRTQYAPRYNKRCMIYAEGCEDIALTGRGVIDCQGQAFLDPIPEDQQSWGTGAMWTWVRKRHPVDPDGDGMVHVKGVDHPIDPGKASYSPGRVIFFIGCRNVLVEDVALCDMPAGWGYWICDCEDVHFHRARIRAPLVYPNTDGIHINCSRGVTVSDCNIACGDDAVVVRAYSLPLYRHTLCERVTVTNCNLTSHDCGIRVGWINDGEIRNCAFSNLTITDTAIPLGIVLPSHEGPRMADQGDEATLIENLSFSNIVMDRCYNSPVLVYIGEHCLCEAIRNLYFSGIHAISAQPPYIAGRENRHAENIHLTDCQFIQVPYETMKNRYGPLLGAGGLGRAAPTFLHVDNLVMNNTVFSVL